MEVGGEEGGGGANCRECIAVTLFRQSTLVTRCETGTIDSIVAVVVHPLTSVHFERVGDY